MQYDQDVVTWSPQGRIHQIEYAMEAVKQGSAVVGLKVTSDECLHVPKRESACLPLTLMLLSWCLSRGLTAAERHAYRPGVDKADIRRDGHLPEEAI